MALDKISTEEQYVVTVGDEREVDVNGVVYKLTVPPSMYTMGLLSSFSIILDGAKDASLGVTPEQVNDAIDTLFVGSKYVKVIPKGGTIYESIKTREQLPQNSVLGLLEFVGYYQYVATGGENPCDLEVLEDPKKKED